MMLIITISFKLYHFLISDGLLICISENYSPEERGNEKVLAAKRGVKQKWLWCIVSHLY